jgi:hypothetical protein
MNPALLKAAQPLVGGLFGLVDDLFTTDEERSHAKIKIMELQASGQLAQLGVNMKEAEHKSLFVAGWRPAVGWVCVIALFWNYILYPVFTAMVSYIAMVNGVAVDFSGIPVADMATMMPVLLGMLGLGAMRTYEKQQQVHSNSM